MALFDWLKNLFSNETVKEVGGAVLETVVETAGEVVKDAASAYLDEKVGAAVAKMRAVVDKEAKLSIPAKAALNAGLDRILQAIEGARDA